MPRLSRHITLTQAENLAHAVGFARQIGFPLNRHLTVLWEHAGVVGRVQDVQARFLELMRKWLQYRTVEAAWVWVVEDGACMGLHSHILVHVPNPYLTAWKRMLPNWLDGDVDDKTIDVVSIQYPNRSEATLNRVKGKVKYLLKGVSSQSGALIGVRPENQGVVPGKRTGTSQNIGRAARSAFAEKKMAERVAPPRICIGSSRPAAVPPTTPRSLHEPVSGDDLEIPDFLRRRKVVG